MAKDNVRGLVLAVGSSLFIGTGFILKKNGLLRAASSGTRAGYGGYTYLLQPIWWAGMVTMFIGEVANFVAYVYAPAVLVTPLGALSIIVRVHHVLVRLGATRWHEEIFSTPKWLTKLPALVVYAVLANFILKERLSRLGMLGCLLCIMGSVVIVLHAPQEESLTSVQQIWDLATQPAFLIFAAVALSIVAVLIFSLEPLFGQSNVLVYLGIYSLMGSLTVVSVKAIGIAIKLTLEGTNQLTFPQTWFFMTVGSICIITQLKYLNKALDTFNAEIVSPIYYVMFTTLTIAASAIMFKDWLGQDASSIASEICGFITVLSGTIKLHSTKDQEQGRPVSWRTSGEEQKSADEEYLIRLHNTDYFDR